MTDVKRYWIDDDRKIEDMGEVTQRDLLARLSRDEARAFVRVVLSDDYDALRAEVERLTRGFAHIGEEHAATVLNLQRQLTTSQAMVKELQARVRELQGYY